jgi:hypothetical protein
MHFAPGDMAPGKEVVGYGVSDKSAHAGATAWGAGEFPDAFSYLALQHRIGSVYGRDATPGAAQQAADYKTAATLSDTGELRTNPVARVLQVTTPRTRCFVFNAGGEMKDDLLTVRNFDKAATVAAVAMDGQPLAQSRRILLFHLTDGQNTGQRYRTDRRQVLEKWGELPYLVRVGRVAVTMAGGGHAEVFRLDMAGRRGESVPAQATGDRIAFEMDGSAGKEPAMMYELVR